jgi:hypothetical protein
MMRGDQAGTDTLQRIEIEGPTASGMHMMAPSPRASRTVAGWSAIACIATMRRSGTTPPDILAARYPIAGADID